MTTGTIQGQLLFEGGVYCNVMMIAAATIQKQVKLYKFSKLPCEFHIRSNRLCKR